MIDEQQPIGAGLSRDIATGKEVEAETDAMLSGRHDRRVVEEGGRPAQEMWVASVRRYNVISAQAILEDKLDHARAMHRSHEATFAALTQKWEAEIDRCEALLGINGHGRKKAS